MVKRRLPGGPRTRKTFPGLVAFSSASRLKKASSSVRSALVRSGRIFTPPGIGVSIVRVLRRILVRMSGFRNFTTARRGQSSVFFPVRKICVKSSFDSSGIKCWRAARVARLSSIILSSRESAELSGRELMMMLDPHSSRDEISDTVRLTTAA